MMGDWKGYNRKEGEKEKNMKSMSRKSRKGRK